MCPPKGGIALGGNPKGNGSGGTYVSRVVSMCIFGNDTPKSGEGGMHRGKGSTLKHYQNEERKLWGEDNNRRGSWFSNHAWFQELKNGGIKEWFKWVFTDLSNHEESCKWRRFCQYLGA